MRCFLCVLVLSCSAAAQSQSSLTQTSAAENGSFYVNGIVYRYVTGADYTVVSAAHSAINHKFVAVKVRVYNLGQQSVTVKPEDVSVEDTLAGHTLAAVSGAELARRMRRPYNWARMAVNPVAGDTPDTPVATGQINPQLLEMVRAMAARANAPSAPMLSGRGASLHRHARSFGAECAGSPAGAVRNGVPPSQSRGRRS